MIPTVDVWEAVSRLAKSGTAGYQDDTEFNIDLKSVQYTLMGLMSPLNSVNQTAKDILSPFMEPLTGSSDAQGVLAKPADYFQLDSIIINGYPVFPIETNELAMIQYIPTRRPNASENRYYYFQRLDSINILPAAVYAVSGTYIRKPDDAGITLTPVSTPDRDYVTPTSAGDLEWNERVFNIIVYMMLLKLGLAFEKQILFEFSQLGIALEQSTLNTLKQ